MNIAGIVTAAGLGTRDGPWTLMFPKAMLPVVVKINDEHYVRPFIDLIMIALTKSGCSRVCVVRRSDDDSIVKYSKVLWGGINIDFPVQDQPRGFGDAVYRGLRCIGDSDWVIIHADDGVLRGESMVLMRGIQLINKNDADGLLFVRRVNNPSRYGVVQEYVKEGDGVYRVLDVEEKPRNPKTNLALLAVYIFKSSLINAALSELEAKNDYNVELTDAIRVILTARAARVLAIEVDPSDWLSIGTPNEYARVHSMLNSENILELI